MRERVFSITKKDLIRKTSTKGGKGGQKVNKTESVVTFTHKPSGTRGKSSESRSQQRNEKIAFKRLGESKEFKSWCRIRVAEISTGETIEQIVEREMQPENIKIEYGI